jgi:antitoxin MazE
MKTKLVRIGNSRGIRIPKPLIEQLGFKTQVELLIEENQLIIRLERRLREGWGESFRLGGPPENQELLLEGIAPSRFDEEEWEW